MMGALIALAASAHAQQDIGATAAAHKEVSRELSGASAQLNTGDPVFRDEVVRTGTESTAKLVFLDSTNLAVGPISRVVLDRFIYDPAKSAESLGVKLAKGVLRFTTGGLHKDAYIDHDANGRDRRARNGARHLGAGPPDARDRGGRPGPGLPDKEGNHLRTASTQLRKTSSHTL